MTRPWHPRHRDPALLERDLQRHRTRNGHLFPQLEQARDISRGDMRLAAEVVMAETSGRDVPSFARERAFRTIGQLAQD